MGEDPRTDIDGQHLEMMVNDAKGADNEAR